MLLTINKKENNKKDQKNFTAKLAKAAPTRIPFACQMSTCHRKNTREKKTKYK